MKQSMQSYQDRLVEELKEQSITSPAVLQAFASTPRHCFIHTYYDHQPGQRTWVRHESTDTQQWYQRIYSDQPFVTLVDVVGRTLSSSSQPSIMAHMLEALDVHPGQRVLEIGTGTGYNAALLSCLTNDPDLVTTIDVEPRAAGPAQKALYEAGFRSVHVVSADGQQGYAPRAPYDRIIATASTPTIPDAWKEHLAPEGILVAVLQPGMAMAGGVLQAVKHEHSLAGKLLHEACFMPLHDGHFEQLPASPSHIDLRVPVIERFSFALSLFDPTIIWTASFQFFLYAAFPTIHIVEQREESSSIFSTLFFDEEAPNNYISLFEEQNMHHIEIHGRKARAIWTRLIRVYTL